MALFDITPQEWQRDAVCRDKDMELFFDKTRLILAKRVCQNECSVISECLEWALEKEKQGIRIAGVVGGLSPRERSRIS